jgi:hypothetical protein
MAGARLLGQITARLTREQTPGLPGEAPPDAEVVTQLVITGALSRLEAQLRDDNARDLKALGVLGADAAALGVLIAAHDAVSRLWWVPAAGLTVAGLLLLVTVWPRKLDEGPNWREFYDTFGGGTASDVGRQMLAELLAAIDENERRTRTRKPNAVFKVGLILMAVSVVTSVLIALVGYASTVAQHDPTPKSTPPPKLPKPAVAHVYVEKGLGFGRVEKRPTTE